VKYMAHPLGGNHMVDRWCDDKMPEGRKKWRQVVDMCHSKKESTPCYDPDYFRHEMRAEI
jgi:hypothetical protein